MLEARHLVKRYPGVVALDDVSFSLAPGEIVGLIGENGAGKSTLIKVLAGLIHADEGEVAIDGAVVHINSPRDATALGIGIIHQELNNLDNIDIAGNVFLGREPRKMGLMDRATMHVQASELIKRVGLDVDAGTRVSNLSIAQQQLVEIAKALSLHAKYVIMDEPTSSLTLTETETLIQLTKGLAKEGVGVVYVSHRLDEVVALADRVVALRDGKNAGDLAKADINHSNMIRLMVGRDISGESYGRDVKADVALSVKGLRTDRYPEHEVSFEVLKGEILGFAGLVGAGRSEVARAIFGVDRRRGGEVILNNESVPNNPGSAVEHGLFLAPEDRRKQGLITDLSVLENITMPALPLYAVAGLLVSGKERQVSEDMKAKLGIKAPTVDSLVRGLSGGNQQKVVLGKWLSLGPKCLILDEPTRGIDVGARAEIYDLMRALTDQGVAILMISSDMEEILKMSDRVAVMSEGRLTGILGHAEASQEAIMHLAVGHA